MNGIHGGWHMLEAQMPFWNTVSDESVIAASGENNPQFQDNVDGLREGLQACCRDEICAAILQTESNRICQASFSRVSSNSLVFDVNVPEGFDFLPLAACLVSYFHEGKAYTFVSRVRESHPGNKLSSRRLFLRLPEQVAVSQARWTFRVSLDRIEGFEVTLTPPWGSVFQATPLDLSLGGMRIEFPEKNDPDLDFGSKAKLSMRFEGHEVVLRAEIRSRENHAYGLFFPEVLKDGELDPPESYRSIVNAIEKQWLKLRSED